MVVDDADLLLGRLVPPELRELLRARTLILRRPVWGRRQGRHRSARAGVGLDFRDHRPYAPGDDPRRLDWRAVARRDRLVLRQTEAEEELSIVLLLDQGGGMAYGESSSNKGRVARAIAGGLAWLASRQGDPIAAAIGHDGEIETALLRPAAGHDRLVALARVLGNSEPAGVCPWPEIIAEVAPRLRPRSVVVLISDLLDPSAATEATVASDELRRAEDELWRGLTHLRGRKHDIVVVQVLHRDELEFPWTERKMLRFEDLRGVLDPHEGPGASLREGYLARLDGHLRRIESTCERGGMFLHRVVTDELLPQAFMAILARLSGADFAVATAEVGR